MFFPQRINKLDKKLCKEMHRFVAKEIPAREDRNWAFCDPPLRAFMRKLDEKE